MSDLAHCRRLSVSARRAQREPAWCDGAFTAGNFSDVRNDVCMLTPVHAPNFLHLARRLDATQRLSLVQPPPTTVVVFDDGAAQTAFCRAHRTSCTLSFFSPLNLNELIGEEMYLVAQSMLHTGGYINRERLRDRMHGSSSLARECSPKFGGQCYQSLKKFYGAAEGPSHCRVYWVSDAESFPFRPFNFSSLTSHTTLGIGRRAHGRTSKPGEHRPFLLVPSWYFDRHRCVTRVNLFDDSDCASWISHELQLNDRFISDAAAQQSHHQTVYDINNWWFYDKHLARAIIDRTEQLRKGEHFVRYFASLQVPDIIFFRANFDFFARQKGCPMASRDYLRVVERHFPTAFSSCCKCSAILPQPNASSSGRTTASAATAALHDEPRRPCYALTDLWGPCFRKHVHRPSQLASFLVEQLGIFGIFGNEIDRVPRAVLDADTRLSWVVNNAYKWRDASRYTRMSNEPVVG